jgi:hypothetical protein
MATEPNVVGQIAPADPMTAQDAAAPEATPDKTPKPKLSKALPSERVSWEKQLVLLRCFAIGAGPENKPVSNQQLADLAKLHINTAGINNTFYADAGFITKMGQGYTPVAEVVSFERAYGFNPETAGQKLAPALRRSWFGQALLPKLAVRSLSEDDALGELAHACLATKEHTPQLRTLLDYLALGSVIERDGATVKQGRFARDDGQITKAEDTMAQQQTAAQATPNNGGNTIVPRVNTSFNGGGAAGGLQLSVNINVDMVEMTTWPPAFVKAFMEGLAQVISAKAQAENIAARQQQ